MDRETVEKARILINRIDQLRRMKERLKVYKDMPFALQINGEVLTDFNATEMRLYILNRLDELIIRNEKTLEEL